MGNRDEEIQDIQRQLKDLLELHQRTKAWFWRTGTASLAAAAAWLFMWNKASNETDLRTGLAVAVAAVLMWFLFIWAFMLLRKMSRVARQALDLKQSLERLLARPPTDSADPAPPA